VLQGEDAFVFWLGILACAIAAVAALCGLLYWILTSPGIAHDLAKDGFRVQQDYRALRRAGKLPSR
jgi:hypothetical protein